MIVCCTTTTTSARSASSAAAATSASTPITSTSTPPCSSTSASSAAAKESKAAATDEEATAEALPLTDFELDAPVIIQLEETETFTLLAMEGTAVAMDSPIAASVQEKNTAYEALLSARDFVLPEDVQAVLPAVVDHRLTATDGGDRTPSAILLEQVDAIAG